MMVAVAERFHRGAPPASLAELADELGVSPRLVTNWWNRCVAGRLLVEVECARAGLCADAAVGSIHLEDILEACAPKATSGGPTRPGRSPGAPCESCIKGFSRLRERRQARSPCDSCSSIAG